MNFWWLAVKDLLLVARDKKAILTLILMPLILIAILGSAFGNVLKGEGDAVIEKFTLGVVNLDDGPISKALVEELKGKELAKQIQFEQYGEKDLKQKIKDQTIPVGIVIQPHFSSTLLAGKEANVTLLSVPDPSIKATIVQSILEQFSQSVTVEAASAQLAHSVQNGKGQNAAGAVAQPSSQQMNQPLLHETTITAKTKPVGSFQYYAAAMGVMFLLMTVVQGVSAMILEKEQEVYKRLLVTNLTYINYLAGKMLGLFFICLMQAFIIIAGTKLLYGVDWGRSVPGVIAITIAYVFSGCGLGVLAGSLLKTEKSFSVAGMFGTQILSALGGSMVPLYIFPDWVRTVMKFLPNGLALQSYLNVMSGTGFAEVLPAAGGLLGLGLLFFAIGLFRLSTERRGKYA